MLAKSSIGRTFLVFLSVFAALALFETGWRFYDRFVKDPVALNLVNFEKPYLYFLNPDHPDISSQSLRDNVVYPLEKPEGSVRILALGDSVTYGLFVDREKTFSKQLEKSFRESALPVEVMNAGVNGYTPYNELYFYTDYLSRFSPDVVLIGISMNDVVHPVLHWMEIADPVWIQETPQEAIPDLEYHRLEVLPRSRRFQSFPLYYLEQLRLFSYFRKKIEFVLSRDQRYVEQGGRKWPVYTAHEDPVDIRVLDDRNSVQWQWLTGMLDRLTEAVNSNGALPVILVFPLQYQLEEGYPFHPELRFREYCTERGLICLDPKPALQSAGADNAYLLDKSPSGVYDVWHLSPEGHETVAAFLRQSLETVVLKRLNR